MNEKHPTGVGATRRSWCFIIPTPCRAFTQMTSEQTVQKSVMPTSPATAWAESRTGQPTPKGRVGVWGRMTPAGPSGSRGSIRCPCDRRPFGPYKRKCKSIVRSRGRKWPCTPENPPVLHTGWNPAPRRPLRRQAASTRSACSPRNGPERSFKAATRVRIPLGSPPPWSDHSLQDARHGNLARYRTADRANCLKTGKPRAAGS